MPRRDRKVARKGREPDFHPLGRGRRKDLERSNLDRRPEQEAPRRERKEDGLRCCFPHRWKDPNFAVGGAGEGSCLLHLRKLNRFLLLPVLTYLRQGRTRGDRKESEDPELFPGIVDLSQVETNDESVGRRVEEGFEGDAVDALGEEVLVDRWRSGRCRRLGGSPV